MIITFNEELNLERTLSKLAWVDEVLIVDSGSTDATLDIAARRPRTRIVSRPFDSFAGQCNFGLAQVNTAWVLSLDADYVLSDQLIRELVALAPEPAVAGYRASFRYQVFERVLRGALYPPRTILYRRQAAAYRDLGHGHAVTIDGSVAPLKGVVFHDDRKPLSRWIASQARYAEREADHLLTADPSDLNLADRVRRTIVLGPLIAPLYALFFKGGVLDGWAGCHYALQRLLAECAISLELLDRRLRRRARG